MQAQFIKTLAVAAALSVSAVASAQTASDPLLTYGVSLGLENGSPALAKVALTKDGELKVVKTVYGQPAVTSTSSVQLTAQTMNLLNYKIETLSDAEIQTTESRIVCMMMPLFGSADRVLTISGKVIDNNAGCWARTHIAPKEAYEQQFAKELEAQIEVLTTQAL